MWWRRAFPWLFALAIALNVLELLSLTVLGWNGSVGVKWQGPLDTLQARVVADPARGAGIREGDTATLHELVSANNFRAPIPGKPYLLIVHRGGRTIRARVIARATWIGWDQIARLASIAWVVVFALLIYVKGEKTKENAYLALILTMLAIESAISRTVFPDVRSQTAELLVYGPEEGAMCLLIAGYSLLFGQPVSRRRRALFGFCAFVITILAVLNPVGTLAFSGLSVLPASLGAALQFNVVTLTCALVCVAAAIPAAAREERLRLGWVVAAFVPFQVGWAANSISGGSVSGTDGMFWSAVQNVSLFFLPAALTYAALSRRLFDIGFVLNRAAVFTGVSTIVVGAFVLLEWALGQWFEGLSHASSLAINGGLALVIGISFRVIHGYVDRAVDTVFFRKRHENEAALRRFAREAAFFTSEKALIERTVATILSHSEASGARIEFALNLDANDPAAIAMKAWQEPVDLSACATSIEGEIAFPMIAHGELLGAIICDAKTTGERFAPDERETLQTLAQGVGLALDGMTRSLPEDGAFALMGRRIDLLARSIDTLVERFDAR